MSSLSPSYQPQSSGDGQGADRLNCFILLQGNHYCSRDYGNGSNSYHYSNQYVFPSFLGSARLICLCRDGSYYYANPNGSTYYNDGAGKAVYTPPPSDGKN